MTNDQAITKLLDYTDSMIDIHSTCSKRALQSKIDAILYAQWGYKHGAMACEHCRYSMEDCIAIAGGV